MLDGLDKQEQEQAVLAFVENPNY